MIAMHGVLSAARRRNGRWLYSPAPGPLSCATGPAGGAGTAAALDEGDRQCLRPRSSAADREQMGLRFLGEVCESNERDYPCPIALWLPTATAAIASPWPEYTKWAR